jgi:hypothetical protein
MGVRGASRAKTAVSGPGSYAIYRSSSQLPSGEAKELFLQTMARPAQRLQLADRLLQPWATPSFSAHLH